MQPKHIASRLLSTHGLTASKRKVTYRLVTYRRLLESVGAKDLPHYFARVMLWQSVRHHLNNS
jgi:hypothetical protein